MTVMVWHAQSLIVLTLQGGDLSDALHRNGRTRLEWASGGRDLALQIALGVSHLHERKVRPLTCTALRQHSCQGCQLIYTVEDLKCAPSGAASKSFNV